MLDAFDLPFVQRGLWAVLLLAVPGGLLGTWIVLRGMAFYAHATGTAAFPGLVVAVACGVLLASDVFGSGAQVDTLLFGSLLVVGPRDLVLAAVAGALAA